MRCQRLSFDGKRCKRKATCFITMHQGEQTYDLEPTWCVCAVCTNHAGSAMYQITNEDFPVEGDGKYKDE